VHQSGTQEVLGDRCVICIQPDVEKIGVFELSYMLMEDISIEISVFVKGLQVGQLAKPKVYQALHKRFMVANAKNNKPVQNAEISLESCEPQIRGKMKIGITDKDGIVKMTGLHVEQLPRWLSSAVKLGPGVIQEQKYLIRLVCHHPSYVLMPKIRFILPESLADDGLDASDSEFDQLQLVPSLKANALTIMLQWSGDRPKGFNTHLLLPQGGTVFCKHKTGDNENIELDADTITINNVFALNPGVYRFYVHNQSCDKSNKFEQRGAVVKAIDYQGVISLEDTTGSNEFGDGCVYLPRQQQTQNRDEFSAQTNSNGKLWEVLEFKVNSLKKSANLTSRVARDIIDFKTVSRIIDSSAFESCNQTS
jgi:hypothetical protein